MCSSGFDSWTLIKNLKKNEIKNYSFRYNFYFCSCSSNRRTWLKNEKFYSSDATASLCHFETIDSGDKVNKIFKQVFEIKIN